MIVWGGNFYDGSNHYLNDGGRYNPATDSWTATSGTSAPSGRYGPTAIWSGSEMIVWGGNFYDGSNHNLNDGGRYSPASDSWTATTGTNAPSGRYNHRAVWSGSEMIVWGGRDDNGPLGNGGRYNPNGNAWTAITGVGGPSGRDGHTAIWTNSLMIIFGGSAGGGATNATYSFVAGLTLYLYQGP